MDDIIIIVEPVVTQDIIVEVTEPPAPPEITIEVNENTVMIPNITVSLTAPVNPSVGDIWLKPKIN